MRFCSRSQDRSVPPRLHDRGGRALAGALAIALAALLATGAAAEDAKLDPALRRAVERAHAGTLSPFAGAVPRGRGGGRRVPPESGPRPLVRIDPAGEVQVYVHLACPADRTLLRSLRASGAVIERVAPRRRGPVQVRVPLAGIAALAQMPCVGRIGLPVYGRPRAGSVTSEGDTILRADDVRASPPGGLGLDGSGVRVGVISAGVRGLAAAQGTGDLPAVSVLDAGCTDPFDVGCAEGTAMLEIVHDLAPGATLGFYGPLTSLDFCAAVSGLQGTFGADVIVDDLGFFAEPYFEDGVVAQCVADAVAAGVVYVSAAGNDAQAHYQGEYVDSGDGRGSHLIGPGNTQFDVSGSQPLVIVQWSNPFGASGDDYDLCLASETPSQCASFNTQQNGDDDPIELDTFACSGGCSLQVRRVSGSAQTIELFVLDGTLTAADRVAADSVFGHPAVTGAVAVGAIDAADPGSDTIEPYSSRGDATVFFPAFTVREKPDITGIDGVSITGAAGFPTPFFGTSASAPHVAAIAALVLQANPALDPAGVSAALAGGAFDLPPPGADSTFGAGRGDAFESVGAVLCGNGVVDAGEQCDDGNNEGGDCCSAACAFEAVGSACSDGSACTSGDSCDGSGVCVPGPCQVGISCGTVCGVSLICQEVEPGSCVCAAP